MSGHQRRHTTLQSAPAVRMLPCQHIFIMEIKKIHKNKYPHLLKQITQLTEEMDIIGEMPSDEYTFLCVIGSRTHSSYGKDACAKIISGLKGYPIVIVSGLAVGIDSIAHEEALKAGLKTIAFPGSGLASSVLYPFSRHDLAKRIVKAGGALISKFSSEQRSDIWTFPSRNRLMAGISHAVLILEARKGSGTLGTADYATEFNRDIMAVPGNIFSELSYGPHMLIQRGAAAVTCADDVLEALGFKTQREKETEKTKGNKRNTTKFQNQLSINLDQLVLTPQEKTICTLLQNEMLSASTIIEKTAFSSSLFSITISELEMKNLVVQEGGSYRLSRN